MPATGLKIVGAGACLPWCSIYSSFQSSLKTSGHQGSGIGFQLLKRLWLSTTKPYCFNSCSIWFCIVLLKFTSSGGEHMARRIVFTDSGFWKYSWAHLVISMTESCWWVMQCRLRARKARASNNGLRPCPLHTEISPVSHNLLMMLCTVDYEICKGFCNLTLRNVVFKVFHNLFTHSFIDWRAMPIFTSASLRHPFYS